MATKTAAQFVVNPQTGNPSFWSSYLNSPKNFVDILIGRAHERAEKPVFTYLDGPQMKEITLTYGELDRKARAIATHLQNQGLQGQRVLLIYQCDLDYVLGFLACLYAGVIAVPVYPPATNKHFARMNSIVDDCRAHYALSTKALIEMVEALPADIRGDLFLKMIATDQIDISLAEAWQRPTFDRESIAFLQYTSGSTGNPKGVMVTHSNLVANSIMARNGYNLNENDVFVSWLPLYHDLGLIGGILQPILLGARCYLMPPMTIVRPFRWLEAITKYKATVSAGPNFAFDMCVERVTEEQKKKLDLSTVRAWVCGAEPIRYQTLSQFSEYFAEVGGKIESFIASYGLAEATLCVTNKAHDQKKVFRSFLKKELELGRAVATGFNNPDGQIHVGCGRATEAQIVQIVNPRTREALPAGQVGEVWTSGLNIAQGYWSRPQETARTFQNELEGHQYLRTGDLGFLDEDGELYIVGRMKDLIIIRGRNFCPQDIELACSLAHPVLKNTVGAALSVTLQGVESLVVVQELPVGTSRDLLPELEKACRKAIQDDFGISAHEIIFVEIRGVPRTSSGKIRRQSTKEAYLEGTLALFVESKNTSPFRFKMQKKVSRYKMQAYMLFKISANRVRSNLPLLKRGISSSN